MTKIGKKRSVKETLCHGGTQVVTVKFEGQYETEVLGGILDGWSVKSPSWKQALQTHNELVNLIKNAS